MNWNTKVVVVRGCNVCTSTQLKPSLSVKSITKLECLHLLLCSHKLSFIIREDYTKIIILNCWSWLVGIYLKASRLKLTAQAFTPQTSLSGNHIQGICIILRNYASRNIYCMLSQLFNNVKYENLHDTNYTLQLIAQFNWAWITSLKDHVILALVVFTTHWVMLSPLLHSEYIVYNCQRMIKAFPWYDFIFNTIKYPE